VRRAPLCNLEGLYSFHCEGEAKHRAERRGIDTKQPPATKQSPTPRSSLVWFIGALLLFSISIFGFRISPRRSPPPRLPRLRLAMTIGMGQGQGWWKKGKAPSDLPSGVGTVPFQLPPTLCQAFYFPALLQLPSVGYLAPTTSARPLGTNYYLSMSAAGCQVFVLVHMISDTSPPFSDFAGGAGETAVV